MSTLYFVCVSIQHFGYLPSTVTLTAAAHHNMLGTCPFGLMDSLPVQLHCSTPK